MLMTHFVSLKHNLENCQVRGDFLQVLFIKIFHINFFEKSKVVLYYLVI